MDDFGNDLSASGVVLSQDELLERRRRDGQCPTCGRKCFEKKALRFGKSLLADAVLDRLEPLTVEGQVLKGMCLICNPQIQEELDQRASEMSQDAAARSSLDSGAGERRRAGESAPAVSEEDDQADLQSSEHSAPRNLRGSFRWSFRAGRPQSLAQSLKLDDSNVERNYSLGSDRKLFAQSVATLSHDDFFAQFDVPGKKSSFEEDDAPRLDSSNRMGRSVSLPEPHNGDSHDKPIPSSRHASESRAEQERSSSRRKTPHSRDASRHQLRKRGGREKALRRGKLSSGTSNGRSARSNRSNSHTQSHSQKRSHRSRHIRSQSNPRSDSWSSLARSQSNAGSQINTRSDSNRQRSNGRIRGSYGDRRNTLAPSRDGHTKAQRGQRSEKIGKIMRKSQENWKFARAQSQRRLKSVHWESSGASSSSSSDEESSSSESGDSGGSDEDGDEASVGKSVASWREKVDPQEKMESILDHFSRVATGLVPDLAGIRDARSRLKEEEASTNKAKWYASKQLKDAQEQQAFAAEREDYEVADELGTVIKGNLKALKKQTQVYQGIRERMAKIDERKEEAVKSATLCLKKAQVELGELQDELADRVKEDGEVLSRFYEESNRLSGESERLAQELKVIEKEEESFAIAKEEVVGMETKELEEELKDASAKLVKVNDTMQELRKQLERAEAEALFLNKRIEFSTESIEDIHFRHSEELAQLEFKFRLTKERRNVWESESKTVKEARSAHEAAMEAHAREVESRERVIEMTEEERLAAVDLEKIVADAFNAEEAEKAQDDNDNTAEVDEIIMYEALVDEKQELLFDAENNIEDLADEISSIEARLPALEAKKKSAASARDFKLASKASRKIKKALARKEQCLGLLNGGAREREQAAKDEFERYTSLLETKRKTAEERGREAGMKRMEQLKAVTSMLRFVESKLANAPEEEVTRISAIGGILIDAQRSALEAEGRALGEKYGGWEGASLGNDAVERAPSTQLIPERRTKRTRLSLLLDEKMGSRALSQVEGKDTPSESLGEEDP